MDSDAAQVPTPGVAPPDGPPPAAPTDDGTSTPGAAGPGTTPPPFGAAPIGSPPPPPGGAGFTSRYGLVRPRDGRYLAGVCAAIGRATMTDPVLWRVLLAVLGFFGGIGILVYVAAWLIIPGEGDSASPVESMLGRGRSSMSPVTVIVLSILVAVSFAYIVTDAFRALLLGATILVGGSLLLNREHRDRPFGPVPSGPGAAPPGPVPPVTHPGPSAVPPPSAAGPTVPGLAPAYADPTTATIPVVPTPAPASDTPTEPTAQLSAPPLSAAPPAGAPTASWPTPSAPSSSGWPTPSAPSSSSWPATPPPSAWPASPPSSAWPAPPPLSSGWPASPVTGVPAGSPADAPPPPGYRQPFAPHGPYAGPPLPPPPPSPRGKPRKRPRERSALGGATFSLIFLALGLVAVLDLLDVFGVGASAYFAAALATIGLGLLVGTWFGRARWLIALGLVTTAALAVATVADSYDRIRGVDGAVTWAPASHAELATRYENSFGDAVLDLRAVEFTGKSTEITVSINFGQATVVVPPDVDVTTLADVNAGDATVFGRRYGTLDDRAGGVDGPLRETVDVGADGAGGGTLRLFIHVNAGNLEVTR